MSSPCKRQIYEANPWIARNLMDAFEAAKRASLARMREIQTSHLPTAWGAGGNRARAPRAVWRRRAMALWSSRPTARTLEPFLTYCHEQGVTERRLKPEELFPKELAFEVRI